MPSSRLLCFLLLPLIAFTTADDLDEEYTSRGKEASPHELSEPLSLLPSDSQHLGDHQFLPKLLAAMMERLQGEQPRQTPGEAMVKRVFCNGFTGCGGRFRGRRRQHPGILGKRPFCNMSGCGNIGKRQEETKPIAQKPMRLPEVLRKRLFCNAYGGCQGKRALYSNWLSKLEGIADNL